MTAVIYQADPGDIMVLPNDDRNEAYMISKTEFEKTHIAKGEEENRKKVVVFYLDGTLLYTLEDLKNAKNYGLKRNGIAGAYTRPGAQICGETV